MVTQIAWDGSLRRRVLDTAGLPDVGRWETLIEQILAAPPPYRAAPGRPVYVIHAGDRAIVAAEDNLTGPLRGPGDRDPGGRQPRMSPPAGPTAPGGAAKTTTAGAVSGAARVTRLGGPRPQSGPVLGAAGHGPDEKPKRDSAWLASSQTRSCRPSRRNPPERHDRKTVICGLRPTTEATR
jgi:hypothetical protein